MQRDALVEPPSTGPKLFWKKYRELGKFYGRLWSIGDWRGVDIKLLGAMYYNSKLNIRVKCCFQSLLRCSSPERFNLPSRPQLQNLKREGTARIHPLLEDAGGLMASTRMSPTIGPPLESLEEQVFQYHAPLKVHSDSSSTVLTSTTKPSPPMASRKT